MAVFAGVVAGWLVGSDDGASAGTSTDKANPGDVVRSLAVIEASGGEWNADTGVLTLTGVASKGVEFTDRPTRKAGSSDVTDIIASFFQHAPPNAALEYEVTDANSQVAVVELSDPAYDADQATLSFDAQLLKDPESEVQKGSALVDFVLRSTGELPPSWGATTVFLDSAAEPLEPLQLADYSDQGPDGDQYRLVLEGEITQEQELLTRGVSCVFRSPGAGKFNYIAREPSSPQFSIFNAPRYKVDQDAGGPVIVTASKTEGYDAFSGFATHARIEIRRRYPFQPDLDTEPHHYKITIWCSQNKEGAWLVAN
jgi:hypothetical protein